MQALKCEEKRFLKRWENSFDTMLSEKKRIQIYVYLHSLNCISVVTAYICYTYIVFLHTNAYTGTENINNNKFTLPLRVVGLWVTGFFKSHYNFLLFLS